MLYMTMRQMTDLNMQCENNMHSGDSRRQLTWSKGLSLSRFRWAARCAHGRDRMAPPTGRRQNSLSSLSVPFVFTTTQFSSQHVLLRRIPAPGTASVSFYEHGVRVGSSNMKPVFKAAAFWSLLHPTSSLVVPPTVPTVTSSPDVTSVAGSIGSLRP